MQRLLALQRSAGNRATAQLLSRPGRPVVARELGYVGYFALGDSWVTMLNTWVDARADAEWARIKQLEADLLDAIEEETAPAEAVEQARAGLAELEKTKIPRSRGKETIAKLEGWLAALQPADAAPETTGTPDATTAVTQPSGGPPPSTNKKKRKKTRKKRNTPGLTPMGPTTQPADASATATNGSAPTQQPPTTAPPTTGATNTGAQAPPGQAPPVNLTGPAPGPGPGAAPMPPPRTRYRNVASPYMWWKTLPEPGSDAVRSIARGDGIARGQHSEDHRPDIVAAFRDKLSRHYFTQIGDEYVLNHDPTVSFIVGDTAFRRLTLSSDPDALARVYQYVKDHGNQTGNRWSLRRFPLPGGGSFTLDNALVVIVNTNVNPLHRDYGTAFIRTPRPVT